MLGAVNNAADGQAIGPHLALKKAPKSAKSIASFSQAQCQVHACIVVDFGCCSRSSAVASYTSLYGRLCRTICCDVS